MKNKWIAALALAGLLLTTGAYAESTPSETGAPVQAEAAAEPQHQLKVTTKYRYFISQYHYIRERKVSYFDNVYAYNHGEYGLTPFASTVPEEYFVADENGTLAIAPIVLDITDAMRERLYGADVGETALYYGQYCQREKDRKGVWGYTGIHEGIDFVNVKGAPLYAILGGEVTRGTDKNGTVAIYNAEYDITLLYLHCENSIVRRGDTVEAGAMIAKEGKKNIKGGDKTHYTHVELRKGRHTSSSPYRDIVLTSDCPYAVMQQALGVVESGRQPITAAAVTQAQRMREEAEAKAKAEAEAKAKAEAEAKAKAEAEAKAKAEAEAKAKAEAEAAQRAAEEEAKAKAEAELNSDITIVDNLPGTNAGYGFSDATTAPQATATPVPEATLPPTNP